MAFPEIISHREGFIEAAEELLRDRYKFSIEDGLPDLVPCVLVHMVGGEVYNVYPVEKHERKEQWGVIYDTPEDYARLEFQENDWCYILTRKGREIVTLTEEKVGPYKEEEDVLYFFHGQKVSASELNGVEVFGGSTIKLGVFRENTTGFEQKVYMITWKQIGYDSLEPQFNAVRFLDQFRKITETNTGDK